MRCPECDSDLSTYTDIAVHGGSIDGNGYINGTFPCPECDERLNYEAKMCSGTPF